MMKTNVNLDRQRTWKGRRMRINVVQMCRVVVPAALTISLVAGIANSYAATARTAAPTPSFQTLVDSNLVLLGPVESVNASESRIQVLGQSIAVPKTRTGVIVGELVAIYGAVKADGSYKVSSVSQSGSSAYVPGATELYLKGVVTYVNKSAGVLRVGSYVVNYGGALHTLVAENLAVGDVASFAGLAFPQVTSLFANNGAVVAKA